MDKTISDFETDGYQALKQAKQYLDSKGYKTSLFANMEGDTTLSVEAVDDEGELSQMIAVFERVQETTMRIEKKRKDKHYENL